MLNFQIFGYYTLLHDTNEITLFFLDNFHYFRKLRPVRNWCATWILVLLGVQSLNCQTAKNSGEPKKMTNSLETEVFQGGPNGKVVAPGILVICPVDKNSNYHTKNWLFAPNIQILGSKKHIFAPSGQFEPHRSMFSTRKRCLIGIPIRGYQNFYSLPPKNWIWGPKTAKFCPKLAFLAKYGHFLPIWSNTWPQNNVDKLPRWFFRYVITKTFICPHKNKIFGPKPANFGPKYAIMVILGQILVFLDHFV